MNIPQIIPATDLQTRDSDILNLLGNGPIVLTQQERASAILISVDEWEAQNLSLQKLQAQSDHLKNLVELLQNKLHIFQYMMALSPQAKSQIIHKEANNEIATQTARPFEWKTYDIGLIDDTFTFRREDIYDDIL